MYERLEEYRKWIVEQRIVVLGLGISNVPLIRLLHSWGAKHVVGFDRSDHSATRELCANLQAEGLLLRYYIGQDYMDYLAAEDCTVLFKTPVIRYDIPELLAARDRGVLVTSEMEEFLKLCPAKVYAVTGSDGKTTTTTILYRLLQAQFEPEHRVWVGGNIGTPLLPFLPEIQKEDRVVVELSSFQLMQLPVSPSVSVITNLSPNHLDVHKSYEEYIEAKTNIYSHQAPGDVVVLNLDNEVTANLSVPSSSELRYFSRQRRPQNGVFLEEDTICRCDGSVSVPILDRKEILLPGLHNVENYMAALCAVGEEVSVESIQRVAQNFRGVAHRLELVRELKGVRYYNSSIDSSPNRTIHALSVFPEKVILIAGGKDKNIPYDSMGPVLREKVRVLILTGPTAGKIEQAAREAFAAQGEPFSIALFHCQTYEEAVERAYQEARLGEVVVLSPASTSFDLFRNFEERGECFRRLVCALPE